MNQHDTKRHRLPADVCEHLRSKTMYTGSDRASVEDWPDDGITFANFWCVMTQRPWGPDEQLIGIEECRPGRSCCKPRLAPPQA